MSEYTQQDRTLALIGIYQASQLIYDLATTGKADEVAYHTCIQSLFCTNPSNTLEVYGGDIANIQLGVKTLLRQMTSEQAMESRNVEVTRYVLSLIILQKKLLEQGEPLQKISKILETAQSQQAHFGEEHDNVIASIARAYTENVSPVRPKIMINGQHGHLQNSRIANKIRALLLTGIRSALLWNQVGGSRWGLLWSRKKYLHDALALQQNNNDTDDSDGTTDRKNNEPISLFKKD
ncbi:high frequency lysogenization protein HflD [Thiomicrorhabdus arctica]|jgi:high frequency lysogenization protein|uniref:high frequency lysogenization protein HflD n=1 Tax=Thiomicrorhabdus arctica TaxID=131540 RepID=UPI00036FCEA8|nr:high frequency lysogenization protein HflD [Thiomicrorhabdus arctica]